MNRKWLAFPLSAGILIVLGIAAGPALLMADDDESPLEKIMEKVNKHNSTIAKAVRNKVNFTKGRKDVEKSAKELAKLGKEAKPLKDAIKKAKSLADPQKKWDEYMDEFVKTSEKLSEVAGKSDADHQTTKDAFKAVTNSCVPATKISASTKEVSKGDTWRSGFAGTCPAMLSVGDELQSCVPPFRWGERSCREPAAFFDRTNRD